MKKVNNNIWDHPRACGEKLARACFSVALTGSSPRVRGAAYEQRCIRAISRIIPACAGSSRWSCTGGARTRDHPRVCGEQCDLLCLVLALSGSSPRVRGAAIAYGCTRLHTRIIPACAGSRESFLILTLWTRDHPRVCGEQRIFLTDARQRTGSSPRVRGAVLCVGYLFDKSGIIPACAGSSA